MISQIMIKGCIQSKNIKIWTKETPLLFLFQIHYNIFLCGNIDFQEIIDQSSLRTNLPFAVVNPSHKIQFFPKKSLNILYNSWLSYMHYSNILKTHRKSTLRKIIS